MNDYNDKNFIEDTLPPEFSDSEKKHFKRIDKLSLAKTRTILFYNYANANKIQNSYDDHYTLQGHRLEQSLLYKIYSCHSYLIFRNYENTGKIKLHEAKHCDLHLLCPICAIRRASKKLRIYKTKTDLLLKKYNSNVYMYMLTLTVKNNIELNDVYNHLTSSMKKLMKRRRDCIEAKKGIKKYNYALNSIFANTIAGVYSYEVKKGKNSKEWHPHIHMFLIAEEMIDYSKAISEWKNVTGDSCNIRFDPIPNESIDKSFLEIFKYALKFSDLPFKDNYEAFTILRGKRLLGSFGEFRGLENEEIDESEEDLENFLEMLYRFDYSSHKYSLQ